MNPQETIPITVPFWINGPPESPEHVERPPDNGPVQRFVAPKFGIPKPSKWASQSACGIIGRTAVWRMSGRINDVSVLKGELS